MSLQPEWVFEATDYEGTPVVLSRATWHAKAGNDTLGIHPEIRAYLEDHVVEFFERVPGLAFLHRLVLALPGVFVAIGACGMRLVCFMLEMTGLNLILIANRTKSLHTKSNKFIIIVLHFSLT